MNSDDQRLKWDFVNCRQEIEAAVVAGSESCLERLFLEYPAIRQAEEEAVELIYLDFVLREESGEHPQAEDYIVRFPDFANRLPKLFEFDSLLRSGFPPLSTVADGDVLSGQVDTLREQFHCDQPAPVFGDNTTASFPPVCVIGEYDCLEVVGRGGMGVVYRAIHRTLQRPAAVKVITLLERNEARAVGRLLAEARLCGLLNHPNIVQVFDSGTHDQSSFYAMEYISGGSLVNTLSDGPLAPGVCAKVINVLALALGVAHSHSIIHRDIKPGNILLAPVDHEGIVLREGTGCVQPKIADFGLAKSIAEPAHHTQSLLGTPSYMPPEQILASGEVDVRSDVYSLGALLFHLLVGKPPFQAATTVETMNLVLEEEPPSLRQLQPNVPRDLETICVKCLQKASDRRYQSAAELADDLQRYLDGRPILARPIHPIERTLRWARRNPLSATLLLLVGLTAFVSTGLWLRAEAFRRTAVRSKFASDRANQQTLATLRKLTEGVVLNKFARQSVLSSSDRQYLQEIAYQYSQLAELSDSDLNSLSIRGEGHYWSGYLYLQLADPATAIAHLESAIELLGQVEDEEPSDEVFRLINRSMEHLVVGLEQENELDGAQEQVLLRIERCQNPPRYLDDDSIPECRRSLIAGYRQLGYLCELNGRADEAFDHWQHALQLGTAAMAEFPQAEELVAQTAGALRSLASVETDFRQQVSFGQQSIDLARQVVDMAVAKGEFVKLMEYRIVHAWALYDLAIVYKVQGELDLAWKTINEAVEVAERLEKEEPLLDEHRSLLAIIVCLRGEIHSAEDRCLEAEQDFSRASELLHRNLANAPNAFALHAQIARSEMNLLRCASRRGAPENVVAERLRIARAAVSRFRAVVDAGGADDEKLRKFESELKEWP